jgi:hypothetical protein
MESCTVSPFDRTQRDIKPSSSVFTFVGSPYASQTEPWRYTQQSLLVAGASEQAEIARQSQVMLRVPFGKMFSTAALGIFDTLR